MVLTTNLNYNKIMTNRINYDVIICGGGTSGCACAYSCAKFGLKTLLIEKNNFLGGLMTGGLVVPVMKSSSNNLNCDYYNKLVKTAKKFNAQITYKDNNDGWFNPEILKIVIEDILTENEIKKNLDILLETQIFSVNKNNSLIKDIVLNSNLLSLPIVSTYYVDATGSGEFSILAGCSILNDKSEHQQNSLRFILDNVNFSEFSDFLINLDDDENITNIYRNEINSDVNFTTASTWDENTFWKLDKFLKSGVENGLLLPNDRSYFQIFSVAGTNSKVAFNCPRISNYANNPYMASNELIEAKKAIWRIYKFEKKTFPGFENSQISNIATQTGIREQNRIKTKYHYTKNDLISGKKFENNVLEANYGIDVHTNDKKSSIIQVSQSYQLPIETLMSYDYDNLFIIGKPIGADFYAHSALRVQKSCMSMGEGVAKYIAKIKK